MSNFSILVIGDNSSERMAQWQEFEYTGNENPYVQDINITEEALAFADNHKSHFEPLVEFIARMYNYPIVPANVNPADCEKAKYGYVRLNENNELDCVIRRTNPNAKFDFFGCNDKWRGFFKMKNGGHANSVIRGEAVISTKHLSSCVSAYIDDSGYVEQFNMPEKEWHQVISSLVKGLGKDARLTVFGCHK